MGTHQKRLSEVLLMSTHNICLLRRNKKNVNILVVKALIQRYEPQCNKLPAKNPISLYIQAIKSV